MDLNKGNVKTGPDEKLPVEVQEEVAPPPRADLPANRCPACPQLLPSSGELTNHLHGHNSPHSTDGSAEDEYTCGVCQKTLSSASSLARHVLVHSGERPFKCKFCDMAFTTNGNMNRHLRSAHGDFSPASYTDSEGSSDSEKPPLPKRQHIEEYNNNDIDKRKSPNPSEVERDSPDSVTKRKYPNYRRESTSPRKREMILGNSGVDVKTLSELQRNINDCPVCGKQDFTTGALLESHIERCHPDFPATCEVCSLTFKNHRVLNLHRFMVHNKRHANGQHVRNSRNSIVGFHDLTFVDFSSGKFPTIARAVCEQSMHKPAMGEVQFQCSKCLRGFPCRTALDAHETDCGTASPPSRVAQDEENPDHSGQSRRDDFFAGLDLQNIAALTEAKEGKDLADIQSIISNTAKLPLPVLPRSDTSTPENNVKFTPNSSSSGSSGTFSSENHEEEAQDAFAAEFRKMKLKGEFPCRLCTAVFPNLRALKGHNRAHMGVAPGVPYPCNMCPYTSTDKATLVRHLRSHNGDRPYECSLCNYAFTTKANCERHVRNRHGKLTREDIKSVLIYHPNEDSTNDNVERNSLRVIRDDTRKVLLYPNEREESIHQSPLHFSSMPMETAGEIRIIEEAKLRESALSSLCTIQPSRYDNANHFSQQRPLELIRKTSDDLNELREANTANSDYSKADEDLESRSSDGSVSLVNDAKANTRQITQASPINLKKHSENTSTDNNEEDGPLDLSMDVLDLSKKSEKANNTTNPDESHYERNPQELYDATNQLLLTQALLETGQGSSQSQTLESLYANAHLVYRNFGTFSGILPPYLFDPRTFSQDFAMKERLRKELVRGLQLTSGGTLVEPTINNSGFAAFTQGRETLVSQSGPSNERTDYAQLMSAKIAAKVVAPRDKPVDSTSGSNSVKMVIKNGVLMPKQKQRRYRTERPFTCEHCAARFTLRSNMERHIKQQHPQHWSQRPRGGHSTRGRPPANHPTLLQNLGQTNAQLSQSFPNILPRSEQSEGSAQYGKHPISEQVKYAILAQQLKANKIEENESEEELIIDEDPKDRDNHNNQEQTERSTSLLREHLEGTDVLKEEIKIEVEDPAPSNLIDTVEDLSHEENAQLKKEGESQLQEPGETGDLEKDTVVGGVENEDIDVVPKIEHVKEEEKQEDGQDLASVSELLEHASQQYQQFQPQYLSDDEGHAPSTSDGNNSGSDEKSDSVHSANSSNTASSDISIRKRKMLKKKSAYSMAPNRVICPFCQRPFPWTSSLRRHILTHTGQKPFQCVYCSLFFTTKSNCDRHLLRKHKNNPTRMRRALRISSSPEPRASTSNDNSFSMRNVPERPYKCNLCPSSTFSTLGNLKKHRSTKHSWKSDSRPESPSSENRNSPPEQENTKLNEQSDNESHSSSNSENNGNSARATIPQPNPNDASLPSTSDGSRSRRPSPRSSPAPSDVPFKCHLCDNGFAERQDCLEHIRLNHKKSYEMLVAKGALDMDIDVPDEQQHQQQTPQQSQHQPSDGEERRGRFPDYSNRKVVCAFCMRRFWSAEDLRRHMRTHTGERPFSCDICCRRFTLKHSMLRHRKKHESVDSTMYVGTSGDEEISPAQPPTITPRTQQQSSALVTTNLNNPRLQERISLPTVASVATADAAPSGLMNFSPYDELTTLTGRLTNTQPSTQSNTQPTAPSVTDAGDGAENDLISNLLGIPDKSLIDRVLQASADDAAKLLGVKRNE